MPLISLKTSAPVDEKKQRTLLSSLSQIASVDLDKPVQFVMAMVEHCAMAHARDLSPSAYVEIRSIGALSPATKNSVAGHVSELLEKELSIMQSRTFVVFFDVPSADWAVGANTLA
jgi:phenylpyruvate tautomerase PptA (4-oxalocrotonate tautomerase family)